MRPTLRAIRAARQLAPHPAHECLELDRPAGRARKRAPLQLDLCGIAKGYAVDRMAAVLQQHGVRHALVALDGELRAVGGQASGAPWAVALEQPEAGRRAVHGVIELQDLAVATSGDYRRYLQVGDARLAHTMDARRAAPVNNAVASVTVLARTCMHADAWATALAGGRPRRRLGAWHSAWGWKHCFCCAVPKGWWKWGWGGSAPPPCREALEASLNKYPRNIRRSKRCCR